MSENHNVLILGIAGGLAKLTAQLLLDQYPDIKIIGVDSRPIKNQLTHSRITYKTIRYTRADFESLFRNHNFHCVYHLARISHTQSGESDVRRRIAMNLIGTKTIMDLCLKHQVQNFILMSTFHVYGAYHDNPVFLNEHAPLRASLNFADLRDVVEMDQMAQNWMWEYQKQVRTIILRPCNIIGANILNAITKFLISPRGFHPLDYNPLFQFIHELDMARILSSCMENIPSGIYNIAPEEYLSLKEARTIIHGKSLPMPISLISLANNWLNKAQIGIPPYLVDYLKFSCLIDNTKMSTHFPAPLFRHLPRHALELLRLAL